MMVAEIRDPTRDTGIGAGDTVPETQRDKTMGTAQYLVADKVVTLVKETEILEYTEVREGEMVTTPTPPLPIKTGENSGRRSELLGRR